jgi:glycosyltransferase involved in cell wall biosynthesis
MSATVSVIIPVYNGERFLAEALQSVIEQTYTPSEIIVVDDGSTDGTAAVAQAFPVRYLYQANQGPSAARNAGVQRSSGEIIAFLDADDIWMPEKLAKQLAVLDDDERVGLVFCYQRYFFDTEVVKPAWFRPNGPPEGEPSYWPSSWVMRRSAWEKIGPLRPDFRNGEDLDWLSRANDAGLTSVTLTDVLLKKRIHANQLTADLAMIKQGLFASLRQSVRRKRAASQDRA